jgi:putative ABC transport system ATP-binding protein
MNFVALRMLTGDRAKYFGLIFAIAFSTFLLQNQTSIFAGIMRRTGSQIADVTDAEVWVMDPATKYFEQTKALKDTDLLRVRGVPGVEYAVRLFKGQPVARTPQGNFSQATILGIDDATLVGAPRKMLLGSWERLREPDSVVIDTQTISPSPNAVRCRNVQKHFGEGDARIHVLRGVNFEALQGQLTFLVGPSGCGKTTLISVIAGLLDSTDGEVELFGQNTASLGAEEQILFRRSNLGFVFQQYNLLPALTAAENASVPLLAAGVKRAESVDRAKSLLVRLGLENRLDTMPNKLSGGQQQRVALARALIHEPRLVVCDEPTAALDHATGEAVMELLAGTAVHPTRAVIVVTHDSRVFQFADSVAHMDDGRITRIEQRN